MSTERVHVLETAIEKAIEWLGGNSTPTVTCARQVLREALAPKPAPVACPVCPVCGKALFGRGPNGWYCSPAIEGASGEWTQEDEIQRPNRPTPKHGHHAGEWRSVKAGEYYFSALDGVAKCTEAIAPLKRWIAVPDAEHVPVPETVPVVRYWRSTCDVRYCYKTDSDGLILEHLWEPDHIGTRMNRDAWQDHNQISHGEYERQREANAAAKSPAATAA